MACIFTLPARCLSAIPKATLDFSFDGGSVVSTWPILQNLELSSKIAFTLNPTKILPKQKINKSPQCDSAIGLHFSKTNIAPTTTITNNFLS